MHNSKIINDNTIQTIEHAESEIKELINCLKSLKDIQSADDRQLYKMGEMEFTAGALKQAAIIRINYLQQSICNIVQTL